LHSLSLSLSLSLSVFKTTLTFRDNDDEGRRRGPDAKIEGEPKKVNLFHPFLLLRTPPESKGHTDGKEAHQVCRKRARFHLQFPFNGRLQRESPLQLPISGSTPDRVFAVVREVGVGGLRGSGRERPRQGASDRRLLQFVFRSQMMIIMIS